MAYTISIDQGTTSSRAILFDQALNPVETAQSEFTQIFPKPGWVEHDPIEIWNVTLEMCHRVIRQAQIAAKDIAAIGITNQRETVVLWDKETGKPLYNAIVWQDRRTDAFCKKLRDEGYEREIQSRTGLLLDPYFSASKLRWILDTHPDARSKAQDGHLAFGTIDTWLIWNLTEGAAHVTDATNAARTSLYNISTGTWDDELLRMFDIPPSLLPKVHDSAADFGVTSLFGGRVPILSALGDQHAATVGQACFEAGMPKSTYGTGCFALLNTGEKRVESQNRLLTTLAYQFDGKPTYALEGSIFVAGAVVQWLRDGIKIIASAAESEGLSKEADEDQEVIIVPAFTGFGAPYWNAQAKGAIYGLSRNSGVESFARAALQSIGFQTRDLIEAMEADLQTSIHHLRVDGGLVVNDWAMQFLSDILGAKVDRPVVTETTALGAAWAAGQRAGLYPPMQEFSKHWSRDRRFEPKMPDELRSAKYARWKKAVAATLQFTD